MGSGELMRMGAEDKERLLQMARDLDEAERAGAPPEADLLYVRITDGKAREMAETLRAIAWT